jgi:citronellyl-CoA dehydrogenase
LPDPAPTLSPPCPLDVAGRTAAALASAVPGDSRSVWRALGAHGLLAELTPPRLGGLLAALDAGCPVGVVLSVCVQVASALPLLREHVPDADGAGPLAAAYRSAAGGASMLALAATDGAGSGSDLMGLGTTARLGDGRVTVHGSKRWITNACTARHALVLARHRPQRHFTSFLWVLVPTDAPGVHVTPAAEALFPGSGVGTLRLDEVRLGRDHLVGRPGRGLPAFARHVASERLAGGLWAAAMCRRVLAETHGRLTAPPPGGQAMWDNAAVRERFARCLVEAWRVEAACAAFQADADPLLAGMLLKTAVADSLDVVLAECARLAGAEAFVDGGLAQLRAAAGMFATAGGATGALLAGIAEHADDLLRRPLR